MRKAGKKSPNGLVPPVQFEGPQSGQQQTEDTIRRRAYEISLSRGGAPGHEIEDWVQAERELGAH
jgi:hypothetical protein